MEPTETIDRCRGFDDNFPPKIPFINSLKRFYLNGLETVSV
jgi:hypothetical protein